MAPGVTGKALPAWHSLFSCHHVPAYVKLQETGLCLHSTNIPILKMHSVSVSYTSLTTTLQLLQNFNVDCTIWGALKICSVFQLDQKSWDLEMIRSKRLAWPSMKLFKSSINSSIKLFKWFLSKPVTWLCHPDYLPSLNQIAPGECCLTSGRLASSMKNCFFSKANLLNFKGISKFTHLTPFNHLLLKTDKNLNS